MYVCTPMYINVCVIMYLYTYQYIFVHLFIHLYCTYNQLEDCLLELDLDKKRIESELEKIETIDEIGGLYICMFMSCLYVCVHINLYTYMFIYTYFYVYLYIYIWVYMYIYVHTYIYIRIHIYQNI
jgi:hypothetical protein